MKSITLTLFIFFLVMGLHAQQVNTAAPPFTHRTLDHGEVSLSDYSGKIVYLFFFGFN